MCNAGVYQDGDCCTAIEVLRIFLDLSEKYPNKNFCIWCNDNDPEKIGILKRVLNIFPRNSRIQVFISQTDVNEYLDMLHYDSDLAKDIFKYGTATILYIDPFDFGTVEIPKVSIVLQNRYCELIFNFFISDYVRNIHQDAGRITKCLGGRRINTKNELINPYHIQAYFDCLINTYYKQPENELLSELLNKLEKIQSEKAQSMYGRCKALYLAYVEQNYETALSQINETILEFPRDKKYALVVKFDIARLFDKIDTMEEIIQELEDEGANSNTIVISRSKLLAAQNRVEEAVKYFSKNIAFFTEESKLVFCERLMTRHI